MPILIVLYIAWSLASLYFFGETAMWFFESRSLWVTFLAWPVAAVIAMIPGGVIAICCTIFYYLAFVRDWNLFLAFAFVFPGLAFFIVSFLGDGIVMTLEKLRRF